MALDMIAWEHNFASAFERATRERRFVLADFRKDENLP